MSARIKVVRTPSARRAGQSNLPNGLPARLPAGETILWQGAPAWRPLALRALHVRKLSLYFGGLTVLCLARAVTVDNAQAWFSLAALLLLGAIALGLLTIFAVMVSRTTTYTLTDQRVVLRIGVALSMDINLPFTAIDGAALRMQPDGSGDIPLRLNGPTRMGISLLWPHVRPWRTRSVEPMLRAIPDAAAVAQLLARALAASASQQVVPIELGDIAQDRGAMQPAAA